MNAETHVWVVTIFVAALGIGTMYGVFRKMQHGFGPFNLRAVGLVLVATLAGLLATLAPDTRTAAIGLLGAIAGYLFGKGAPKDQ
jgi:hypothetical protein